MERVVILGAAWMPLCKFCGTLWPLSTPGLSGAETPWRRGGDSNLVATCSGGDQGDAVLVEV